MLILISIILLTLNVSCASDINNHTDSNVLTQTINTSCVDSMEVPEAHNNENIKASQNNSEILGSEKQLYVSNSYGNDSNIGDSPDKAFKTLLKAVNSANNGDTINILTGRYAGLSNLGFAVSKSLTIQSYNEDIVIFDGENRLQGLTFQYLTTIIGCSFVNFCSNDDNVISIVKGNIINCTFINCSGGDSGAVHLGSGTITNSTFNNCSSNSQGGAVYLVNNGTITNCIFNNCSSSNQGGAVYLGYEISIINSTFNNCTGNNGGAIRLGSGTITNSTFNNCTGNNGGAIRLGSGTITNSTFNNCTGGNGGAIYLINNGAITNSTFNNCTDNNNSAIYIYNNGVASIIDSNFTNNKNKGYSICNKGFATLDKNNLSNSIYNLGTLSLDKNDINGVIYNLGSITTRTYLVISNNKTINISANRPYNITTELFDDNNNTVTSYGAYALILKINDTLSTTSEAKYDNDGLIFTTEIAPLAGTYIIDMDSYDDPGLNQILVKTCILNVERAKSNITVNTNIDGNKIIVQINMTPNNAAGNISIMVNNIIYDNIHLDENASAIFELDNQLPGTYNINVTYNGDDSYLPSVNGTSNKIDFLDSHITLNTTPTDYLSSATIIVTVTPEAANGNVTFYIDSKKYSTESIGANGTITLNINDLDAGNHVITALYEGNSYYKSSLNLTTLTVNKIHAEISTEDIDIKVDENVTITVTLPDDATGDVTVTVDDKDYTTTVKDGKAIIIVPELSAGNYTADITYHGNGNYNPTAISTNISINSKEPELVVSVPDVIKLYSGSERLEVTVTKDGEAVADQEVAFTINGVTYTRTTGADGKTSIALNLNSGKYTATVKANDVVVNVSVIIRPTIVAKDVTKVFRNGTQYYATFYDGNGSVLANTNVSFNIHGVFYNRTTDANGVAQLNLNLEPGTYILTAINQITGEQATNIITVLSHFAEHGNLVKVYRNASQYVIKLRGDNGDIAGAGEVVTFNINGIFYNRTSDADGNVQLDINLQRGEYIITDYYKNERVSDRITVLKD